MRIIALILMSWMVVHSAVAQQEVAPADTARTKKVIVQNANSQKLDASTDTTYQYYYGDVRLLYDSVYFYSDTAEVTDYLFKSYGDVSIVKGDTLKLFADSLMYYPDTSKAYFYGDEDGNVVLENKEHQLFTNYMIYDLERDIAMYTNRGLLITPDAKVKSGRGFFHVNGGYVNFYDAVTVEGKDFDILTDSLRYYRDSKVAEFLAPVVVTQGAKRIYSESGSYNLESDQGDFVGNAQYVEDGKTSTANVIKKDGKAETVSLIGNAKYRSTDEYGEADSIRYDQKTEIVRLMGDALFVDKEGNEVEGDVIEYNKKSEELQVVGRSVFSKPPYIIVAEVLDYSKETGLAIADGAVVWQDTASKYTIYADHVRYREKESHLKAYNDIGKPLLESRMNDTDTLHVSGDTLIAYEQILAEADTQKVLLAFASVEILMQDDVQAVADSMAYIESEGLLSLYQNPIMWSDSSQFSGDTIDIKLIDDEVEEMNIGGNAVILSTEDLVFFNQIAGTEADTYFREKEVERLDVRGEAKSVYYLLDKVDAYIGANQTSCDRIIFLFENKELSKTHFYTKNEHTLSPMSKVNHEGIKVAGFNWSPELRPMTVDDLRD